MSSLPSYTSRFQHAAWPPLRLVIPYQPYLACRRIFRRPESNSSASSNLTTTATITPRWLSQLKERIGKCIIFGLSTAQTDEAGAILKTIGKDWRALLAGSEGFLVRDGTAGLERHKVVWGEMVSPKSSYHTIQSSCFPFRRLQYVLTDKI